MTFVRAFAMLGLVAALPVLPAAPALAQNQRIVEVYGNDPCPSSAGEEIVVCRRLPAREQFRIPEQLRRAEVTPRERNSGVALAETARAASSATLPNNCSPVGGMGMTGCHKRDMDAARAERRAQGEAATVIESAIDD
ncbi:hypothetical protein [Sphingomonas jatrophae]|uniref:DUF4124 domain-containing protein n=1 Tax=Sphingomonas jatrophae TaxID=1166337 RepID=A0A1I6KXU6_9SPHN|nr:hypothetical protein [Sphingomonas jatrophae]SFR96035.1 hypothetical protein SAMN05192580_1908 [Sphingomonas jatrophae]